MAELKWIAAFEPDEPIIALCQYKDYMLVATSKRVFKIVDDKLYPLKIIPTEEAYEDS